MKQVLVLFPIKDEAEKQLFLNTPGEYCYFFCEGESLDEWIESSQIIIGQPTIEQIRKAKNLEWIQCTFAGVDYYLRDNKFPNQVLLTNSTGAFGQSISEYLLTMLLSLYKKMDLYQEQQRKEIWGDLGAETSLLGKTVLIVGAGDIGSSFAKLLSIFSTRTIGIRRKEREVPPYYESMYTLEELDYLLEVADVVALCLPSTNETRGLMDARRLRRMKKDAVLLNVGRGDALVTEDLVTVLREGHLLGVGLDVIDPEPLPKGHPLWQMERVILTPHIAGVSMNHLPETYQNVLTICTENLERYAKGLPLKNIIDPKVGYRTI
ncbi:MAG: D-2-hydroxyacid dehydrogenase [Velocimicrobium sp.]